MSALRKIGHAGSTAFGWVRLSTRTVLYAGTSSTVGALVPGPKFSQWLFKHWCRATVRQLKIDVRAEHTERATSQGPCVLVANHLSSLDIPLLGSVLDGDYRWVAKREVFRIPFVGWHLWSAGHIPVDRSGGRKSIEDLQARFDRALGRGASVLLFPEGTRSPDGALQKYKMGAFHAAVRSRVPLVPIVVDGTQALASKGSVSLSPDAVRRVKLRILEPVPYELDGPLDRVARELRDRTRAAMVTALDELRGAPGAAELPSL